MHASVMRKGRGIAITYDIIGQNVISLWYFKSIWHLRREDAGKPFDVKPRNSPLLEIFFRSFDPFLGVRLKFSIRF